MLGQYKQEDFKDYNCPECSGKLIYQHGTVRCESDGWFAEDVEIEELFEIN